MKVLVLGAGGIIGQALRVDQPSDLEVLYTRREASDGFLAVDLQTDFDVLKVLHDTTPEVVINLAGHAQVDDVERDPARFQYINEEAPGDIAMWCHQRGSRMIHVSTQGVFSGANAPYSCESPPDPITQYGRQKAEAERVVQRWNGEIARVTFVLGVRSDPTFGRKNPAELILSGDQPNQVGDRWFSPSFAFDVAMCLWGLVRSRRQTILNIGTPVKVSRYTLARDLAPEHTFTSVSHDDFPGLAPRPLDTTYAQDALHYFPYSTALLRLRDDYARHRS